MGCRQADRKRKQEAGRKEHDSVGETWVQDSVGRRREVCFCSSLVA